MKTTGTGLGLLLLAVSLAAAACQRQTDPKPAIERAIQEHLNQRSDLMTGRMVMELKQVHVNGDRAEAEVIFRTTTEPPAQMAYHYELRKDGSQWRVEAGKPGAADSTHPAPGESPASPLPEGHPPIEGRPPQP